MAIMFASVCGYNVMTMSYPSHLKVDGQVPLEGDFIDQADL